MHPRRDEDDTLPFDGARRIVDVQVFDLVAGKRVAQLHSLLGHSVEVVIEHGVGIRNRVCKVQFVCFSRFKFITERKRVQLVLVRDIVFILSVSDV